MKRKHCVVVGAGIAGATAAWLIHHTAGDRWHVTVHDKEAEPGGQLRSAVAGGIRYEPFGVHIAHTSNAEARAILEPYMNGYRHRVKSRVDCGKHGEHYLTWPLQLSELKALPEWWLIEAELSRLPEYPRGDSFEQYAISLMGPTLYDWLCYGYTKKQWGCEPADLSSSFAPKRLDLRKDGNPEMFRDSWQGWCDNGWQSLVSDLLSSASLVLGSEVTHQNLPDADAYVITAALDGFLGEEKLPWRGISLVTKKSPGKAKGFSQPAAVVNTPSLSVPYTRVIEFDQLHSKPQLGKTGTLLCYEYPGADAQYYPVDDVAGENRARHRDLAGKLKAELPNAVLAGRLANYTYIDMDQAVMQGIHAARKVIQEAWRDR